MDRTITVKVMLFAYLREAAGTAEMEIEMPEGSMVKDALEKVYDIHPQLARYGDEIIVSVNHEYAGEDYVLSHRDEMALFPPLSGG